MVLDWGLRIGGALALAAVATVLIKLIHYSVAEWTVYYHLRRSGKEAKATIVQHRRDIRGRSARLYVQYQFRDSAARRFLAEQQVGRQRYTTLQERQALEIRYLPQNPAISRLTGRFTDRAVLRNTTAVSLLGSLLLPPLLVAWSVCLVIELVRVQRPKRKR